MTCILDRSMKKGLDLGIVETVPIIENMQQSPSDTYDNDPFFQDILKESKSKFPARNLLGMGILSPRAANKNHGTNLTQLISPKHL